MRFCGFRGLRCFRGSSLGLPSQARAADNESGLNAGTIPLEPERRRGRERRELVGGATIPLLLMAVALVATYIPARRASRLHPTIALRAE